LTARDYVVTITDGTTTVTLTSSPFSLYDYVPKTPDAKIIDSLNDQDALAETIEIRIMDGSVSDNLAEIRAIQTLLDQAKKAQIDYAYARVYLTLKTSASADEYRSEIVSGQIEYDDETMSFAHWVNNVFLVKLYINRRYYWEATTAVQLDLDNRLATNATAGITIYNPSILVTGTTIAFVSATKKITDSGSGLANFKTSDTICVIGSTSNDGFYTVATGGVAGEIVTVEALVDEAAGATVTIVGENCNYVDIDAADAIGTIASPMRIEMTNANGTAAISYKDIHIGKTHINDLTSFSYFYEGEDATTGSGASASVDTESASSSGGYYNALTWVDDTEKEIATWTLLPTVLNASRGCYWLGIVRLAGGSITASIYLRLSIKLSSTTIAQGSLTPLVASEYMQELGAIAIPPSPLWGLTTMKGLTLALSAKKSGGGTINLDFLEFFPIDFYRNIKQLNYAFPASNTLFIDEFQQPPTIYGSDSSMYYGTFIERGSIMKIVPGKAQRMFFLFDEQDNTCNIQRQHTVKVYYKPRRLSL
jgi:hypothetical protein